MSRERQTFSAHVITGAGRGRRIGIPTFNLDLDDVPKNLVEGIYACFVVSGERDDATLNEERGNQKLKTKNQNLFAALHYGPRPAFNDSVTCEVHIIDENIPSEATSLTLEIIERLRDVRDFATTEALKAEIAKDITRARAILKDA